MQIPYTCECVCTKKKKRFGIDGVAFVWEFPRKSKKRGRMSGQKSREERKILSCLGIENDKNGVE